MARIFHIALESDWQAARRAGRYTTSTRGRSLVEEGFIHASRADQWRDVHAAIYGDVTEPLRLLVIDTERLDVPVVDERPPDAEETYPHIYGPLDPAAVVQAVPIRTALAGSGRSFSAIFLGEMMRNAVLGLLLLASALGGVLLGVGVVPPYGGWVGLLLGVAVGLGLIRVSNRRRSRD